MQLHKLASKLSLFDEKLLVNKIYFNINFLMKNRLIIAGFTPKNRLRQLKLRVFQPINKSELTHQFNFSIIKEWIMTLKERKRVLRFYFSNSDHQKIQTVTLPALELGLSFCEISICEPPSSSFARFRAIGRSTFPAKPIRYLHIVVT